MIADGPLVTIIVATLNSAHRLPRCIASIATQTYPRRELVVMDGGSTDGTVDIIQTASPVTYWESSPDRGIYHAWNKALAHAHGEWICFLGADDYFWSPTALSRIAEAIATRPPQARIVYGRVAVVNSGGEVLEDAGHPWQRQDRGSLRHLPVPYPATFHHASVFRQHGGFDESFRIAGDYDLLVRALETADAHFVDEILVGMEVGGISSAVVNERLVWREILRVWRKHQLTPVVPLWWWWTYTRVWVRALLRGAVGERLARRLLDLYRRATGRPGVWSRR